MNPQGRHPHLHFSVRIPSIPLPPRGGISVFLMSELLLGLNTIVIIPRVGCHKAFRIPWRGGGPGDSHWLVHNYIVWQLISMSKYFLNKLENSCPCKCFHKLTLSLISFQYPLLWQYYRHAEEVLNRCLCSKYTLAWHVAMWYWHVLLDIKYTRDELKGIVHLNIIFSYMKVNKICNLDHLVY